MAEESKPKLEQNGVKDSEAASNSKLDKQDKTSQDLVEAKTQESEVDKKPATPAPTPAVVADSQEFVSMMNQQLLGAESKISSETHVAEKVDRDAGSEETVDEKKVEVKSDGQPNGAEPTQKMNSNDEATVQDGQTLHKTPNKVPTDVDMWTWTHDDGSEVLSIGSQDTTSPSKALSPQKLAENQSEAIAASVPAGLATNSIFSVSFL